MNYKFTRFFRRFAIAGAVSMAVSLSLFAGVTPSSIKLCFTSLIYSFIYATVYHFVPIFAEQFLAGLRSIYKKRIVLFIILALISTGATFTGEFITTHFGLAPKSRFVLMVLLVVAGFVFPLIKSLKWHSLSGKAGTVDSFRSVKTSGRTDKKSMGV